MMLLGRDAECAMVDGALDDARRGRSRVLVFTGEAGIGKSALLEYGRVRGADMRILSVAGVDSETELPFAGLHALLRPVLEFARRIPEHQAEALEAALAVRPSEQPDRLAASAGTLSLLAEVATEQPVLILVDDAHWLDRASAEAIAFAARRFAGEEIALLATVRLGEESTFETRGLTEHRVPPLDAASALALLEERFGGQLGLSVARAIVAATAGNPLALVEIPSLLTASQLDGREALEEPLPVAEGIRRAFAGRLAQLPEATQRSLLVAAAGVGEPLPAVREAAALFGGGSLEPAEAAGLIMLDGGSVAFRHPLLRSAVYSGAPPADRRAAHRALADAHSATGDLDQSAWHRATAAEAPDEEIAAALEAAAERAVERGGHAARARALERAAELSPDPDARGSRLCAAARAADWAGLGQHALSLCERALPLVHDPLVHADLFFQTISTGGWHGRVFPTEEIEREVAAIEQLDPERAAKLLILAFNGYWGRLDYGRAETIARQLEELVDKLGEWWRPRALLAVAEGAVATGDLARANRVYDEVMATDRIAAATSAQSLVWVERYDDARRALAESLALGRTEGNVLRITVAQGYSAVLELALGRLTQATALAGESLTLAEALDTEFLVAFNETTLATVDALQGRTEMCRERVTKALRLSAHSNMDDLACSARIALGLLALGTGRLEDAVSVLEPIDERVSRSGLAEPSLFPYQPDLIEAYVRLGRVDAAVALLDSFERQALAADRRWALAAVARYRGFLAKPDELDDAFARAFERYEHMPSPFERARTELLYGERLRRANRRRDARPHLRAALEAFDEVGAAPWRERASAELRATGESVPSRAPSGRESLTPQELQIALLVVEGKTNRDIGASIYLSPKTVEFHLTRVYRKLELHSRAELIRLFSRDASEKPEAVAFEHA